jgi:hypothetical protein
LFEVFIFPKKLNLSQQWEILFGLFLWFDCFWFLGWYVGL